MNGWRAWCPGGAPRGGDPAAYVIARMGTGGMTAYSPLPEKRLLLVGWLVFAEGDGYGLLLTIALDG